LAEYDDVTRWAPVLALHRASPTSYPPLFTPIYSVKNLYKYIDAIESKVIPDMRRAFPDGGVPI